MTVKANFAFGEVDAVWVPERVAFENAGAESIDALLFGPAPAASAGVSIANAVNGHKYQAIGGDPQRLGGGS
jgi:hypothetical protein